jgi:hypothetical protein
VVAEKEGDDGVLSAWTELGDRHPDFVYTLWNLNSSPCSSISTHFLYIWTSLIFYRWSTRESIHVYKLLVVGLADVVSIIDEGISSHLTAHCSTLHTYSIFLDYYTENHIKYYSM